jgi:hypothetical protein
MKAVRLFGRRIVSKMYGPLKEEESWRVRPSREIQDIVQGADTVRLIQLLRVR